MTWSAQQYMLFENERTRPARDLVAAIPTRDVRCAIDLGCGPGNSTEVLAARYPGAVIAGLDSSEDMIVAARKRLPQLQFEVGNLEDWQEAKPLDVILSNAVLQWVPNHATLLPQLVQKLTSGGSLAIQIPDNMDEPAQTLMRDIAAGGPWADKIKSEDRTKIESANWYYERLQPYCKTVDIWRTVYHHVLTGGVTAIVEWFKSTGLRPFLAALEKDEQAHYLERYEAALARVYHPLPNGTVLLPFPRLFIVATR